MLAASFLISEFLASNDTSIEDEEGDDSDWIEIVNAGDMTGSLGGYFLTDKSDNLTKWQVPSISLDPSERIIIWASEKNRVNPALPMHTNFKIGAGGEYLALIKPDGLTVASEYAPEFPQQYTDVSYGLSETAAVSTTYVDSTTDVQVLIPTNGTLGTTWTQVGFSPSGSWINGPGLGVGYDTAPDYDPYINTEVGFAMQNVNATAYIRAPFTHSASTQGSLRLRIRYDDGFVAYLNGQEVARGNAPASVTWNSRAVSDRIDSIAVVEQIFDLSDFTDLLVDGANVLAIHGLNVVPTSSDFLVDAVLEMVSTSFGGPRYFVELSPGESNVAASLNTAPFLEDVSHGVAGPIADNQNLAVTARITPQGAPIQSVTLRYRIMHASEQATTMFDDGAHGDGAAGDGVYGASISNTLSGPGQMIRYYVSATDTLGNDSRFPYFENPETSQYLGTVVANPSASSQLPIYEWFVQNPNWFRNGDGTNNYNTTSTSLFYNGEFYDNVVANTKGRTSGQDNAPKFELTFPEDHPFLYDPNQERVKKLDLASIYQDPSASRLTLGFEAFREAGSWAPLAFPVHMRMNGNFYRLSIAVERINKPFLDRYDLDNDGAVYKADGVYSGLSLLPGADIGTTNGMEKVNREFEESFDDLIALINGVAVSNPNRQNFLFDNVNLPEVMNTLAMYTITKHYDSATHNYYVYRDSEGDGLWSLIPWDIDLIWDRLYEPVFGRFFSGHPYIGSSSVPSWSSNHWNKLIDAIVDSPITQQMYLRRLRTLMDQILQPTSTPLANRILENRVDALVATLSSEASASMAAFGTATGGSWGSLTSLSQGVSHLKAQFNDRRSYLYGLSIIPSTQPTVTNLYIGDYDQNPSSGIQGEEYIQIVNPNNFAVDISGWSLANAVDHIFVPGTVIPAQGSLYVVRNQNDFRARTSGPSGGQGLIIQGNYDGGLSTAGEIVELLNSSGALINSVQTPAESADFDGDGFITGLDFLTWQRGAGTLAPNGTQALGDADFDRNIDDDDLAVWELQYGLNAPTWSAFHTSIPALSQPLSADLIDAAMALQGVGTPSESEQSELVADSAFEFTELEEKAFATSAVAPTLAVSSSPTSDSSESFLAESIAMELVDDVLMDDAWESFSL